MLAFFFGTAWLPAAAITLCQILYLVPALYAAWRTALHLEPRSATVRLLLTAVLFFFLAVAAVGLLGAARLLNGGGMLFLLWSLGAVTLFIFRNHRTAASAGRLSGAVLAAAAIGGGYLLFAGDVVSTMPAIGTDALLYHFFYPVSWVAEGNVDRIPQQGLVTAAYACYGELFYTFFYLPAKSEFFIRSVPFFILLAGIPALLAAARALHLHPVCGGAAALLLAGCETFYANAVVADTDVLLGMELLTAAVLALLALKRNRTAFWLLAGMMLGCAPATKLLGILLAPFLWLAVVLPLLFLNGRHYQRPVVIFTLAAAATALPYYLVNWCVTGSPAYPQKITLFGRPLWDAYLVTKAAPPVGWNADTWGFFVGDGGMRTPFVTAAALLLLAAGGLLTTLFLICRERRARPGRLVLSAIALLLPVMTIAQCLVYPARTQPRQIIPILMLLILVSLPCWHAAAKKWHGWLVTAAALLLAAAGEWGRLAAFPARLELGAVLAAAAGLLLAHQLSERRGRTILWSLLGAGSLLLASYRFAQSNAVRDSLLAHYLSPESCRAVRILRELDPEERGLKIAYTGIHYGLYTGPSGRNRVRSIPVSKSGLAGAWHYRTFEEERQDGGFERYLERLRKSGCGYLLCEPHHFDAPRPDLEVRWALAHPNELPLLYHEGNLWLFGVTPAPATEAAR